MSTQSQDWVVADELFQGFCTVVDERAHGAGCSILDVINAAGLALATALAQIEDPELRIKIREGTFGSIRAVSNPQRN